MQILKQVFNLPNDSKPREMQAFGLSYKGICSGNEKLEKEIDRIKLSMDGLSSQLNKFIKQSVGRPIILTPK